MSRHPGEKKEARPRTAFVVAEARTIMWTPGQKPAMDKTSDPRLHRLMSVPFILVAVHITPVGKHLCETQFCSVGCYSTPHSLVKCLTRYHALHTPAHRHLSFRCYRWVPDAQNWCWTHLPARQGPRAMLAALGCDDAWETHVIKRNNCVVLKELHTVHPHATDYIVVQMEECHSREDQETSYIRTKEWKNASLVECIVNKVLQLDHTPIAISFPTAITPLTLCSSQPARAASSLFGR